MHYTELQRVPRYEGVDIAGHNLMKQWYGDYSTTPPLTLDDSSSAISRFSRFSLDILERPKWGQHLEACRAVSIKLCRFEHYLIFAARGSSL